MPVTRPSGRRRLSSPLWPPRLAVGFYLLTRVAQLVMLGRPVVPVDASMYRSPGQSWLDFDSTSFLGHSLRPWPVTVVYALAPSDTWRILAQFVIATCCWAFCIWQFGRLTSNRAVAVVASFTVAVLAGTTGVSGFDPVLLSESLTLSWMALYVGALLSLCSGRGRLATLVVAFLSASILGILRPVLIPLIAVVALLAYLLRTRDSRRPARPMATFAVISVLTLGTSAYAWTYNVEMDKTWGDWLSVPGLNGRTLTQYYVAAYGTKSGPELIEAMVDAGAPDCLRPGPPATRGDPSRDYFREDRLSCPEGQAWLSDHFVSFLVGHLARHPGAALTYFRGALDDASVVSVQRAVDDVAIPSFVPGPVDRLFFSRRPGFFDLLVLWSLVAVGAVAVRHKLNRRETDSDGTTGDRTLPIIVGCTLLAGYVALVGTALLSAVDASRVALPVTVLIRLLLIVVIVRTIVAILASRGTRIVQGAGHDRSLGARQADLEPRPVAGSARR